MTRKENLLRTKLALQNELSALRGEALLDIEAYTSGWKFRKVLEDSRILYLEQEIESLKKSIAAQTEKNAKDAAKAAFFATEEGQALKARLDAQKAIEAGAFHEYENATIEELKAWVKNFLGEHWTVKFISDDALDLAVWDANKADFVFGQTIEIRFEKNCYWRNGAEKFETNIGTTGCFDLLDQNPGDRARFYMDFGKFLSDTHKLNWLKNRLFIFHESREAIGDRVRSINAQLENPLGL